MHWPRGLGPPVRAGGGASGPRPDYRWRSDFGISLDGSSNVQSWTDSIQAAVISQGTAGNRPGYTASDPTFNGAPSVTMTGKFLQSVDSEARWRFLAEESSTMVIVNRRTGNPAGVISLLIYAGADGNPARVGICDYYAPGTPDVTYAKITNGAGYTRDLGIAFGGSGVPNWKAIRNDPDNSQLRLQLSGGVDTGWSAYTGAAPLGALSSTFFLGYTNPSFSFVGECVDVAFFNRVLSDGELAAYVAKMVALYGATP